MLSAACGPLRGSSAAAPRPGRKALPSGLGDGPTLAGREQVIGMWD